MAWAGVSLSVGSYKELLQVCPELDDRDRVAVLKVIADRPKAASLQRDLTELPIPSYTLLPSAPQFCPLNYDGRKSEDKSVHTRLQLVLAEGMAGNGLQ